MCRCREVRRNDRDLNAVYPGFEQQDAAFTTPLVRALSRGRTVVGFDGAGDPNPPIEAECVCVDLTRRRQRRDGSCPRALPLTRRTTLSYVIALHEHPGGSEGSFDARRVGLDHVGFHVPERSDLDDWLNRLDERHIEHSGIVEAPYATVVSFRDPDNIALELTHVKIDFWANLVGQLQ